MQHPDAHLLSYALDHPWALTPDALRLVAGILARHLAGEQADPALLAAAVAARTRAPRPSESGGTAIIPVHGILAPRMNLITQSSGGATFEGLSAQLQAAGRDPAVSTIVFDVDSPGGNVAGASEFARLVREAAAQKPVVAVASHTMASAAYWAMSGAREIVASPSAMVGSIGVFSIVDDISALLAQLGIKRSVVAAGRFKGEGVDGGALSPEARAHLQAVVDSAYGRFVADVSRGRRIDVTRVRNGYGEGRLVDADMALHAGMIDRIATLEEVLTGGPVASSGALDGHRERLGRAALAAQRMALDAAAARARRLH